MANSASTHTASTPSASSRNSKNLTVLWELIAFVRPYRWQVSAALLALVFTASLTLSVGHGVRLLIDQGFAQQSLVELGNAVQFILLITVLIAIGTFFRFYLVSSVGERVSADIRQAVFDHVIGLHPSYFETHGSGEIMSRITTDTSLLQNIIGSSFSMAMRSALMCVGAIIMLFATNIKLTLIVLASVPFILVPILIYGRRVRALSRQSQDSMADVGSYAGEAITNIKTVQSFAVEDHAKAAFGQEVERAYQIGRERVKQRAILISGVIVIVFSAITGMLWVGGRDVIQGTMSAGDLGAFVFFAIMVASSMATLSEVMGELQRAAGATERLVELLHVQSHIRTPSTSPIADAQSLSNDIRFDAVHFHYPTRPHQAAIDTLNLVIQPGEVVALVGPSGAGKTTVFELLQRFYDPQSGAIMLGGQDIRSLSPQALRQQMALVPQQPALFSDDVIGNIRYGRPDASEQAVKEAAIQAHADAFIQQLPDGYHSFLGERGVRLSGGQRQRIAIARAILKDPRILLLDEATSALDSESEHAVQQGLAALMRDRTTLIIAHRLSTIQHADRIVVMDQGKLVDVGSHTDLLARCPLYQRLVKRQFSHVSNG